MKRTFVLTAAVICLMLMASPWDLPGLVIASAEDCPKMEEFQDSETGLNYYLYSPANQTENMPLIVYLHGGSGKGSSLSSLTAVDGLPQYLQQGLLAPNAYVLLPQLPAEQRGWEQIGDKLIALIRKVAAACLADEGNISLTGHSMGGTGVWSLAIAYPDQFVRIAPLSGSVRLTPRNAEKIEDIPIRVFVGDEDETVPPESSLAAVEQLQRRGTDAQITVFENAGHTDVPRLTYLDEAIGLLSWLIGE